MDLGATKFQNMIKNAVYRRFSQNGETLYTNHADGHANGLHTLALNEVSKQQQKLSTFLTFYIALTPLVTKNLNTPLPYKFY